MQQEDPEEAQSRKLGQHTQEEASTQQSRSYLRRGQEKSVRQVRHSGKLVGEETVLSSM